MRGCALRLVVSLAGLAALVVGIGAALSQVHGTAPAETIGVSIGAGLFGWISFNLLLSANTARRERAALLAGIAGVTPADGQQAILVGAINPTGAALRAPLSGRECVAYTFEIYELRDTGGSKGGMSKVVYCDGTALTPSAIATSAGAVSLLAVPELQCDDTELEREATLPRAVELLRTIPYAPAPAAFTRPAVEQQWNDDDGAFRRERRHVEGDVDLMRCRMSERIIERGARVCVFGQYSASRRAIVPDPHDWSKITRVMKGDPDAIARQLGASMTRRLLGALLGLAAAAGLLAAFLSSLPIAAV